MPSASAPLRHGSTKKFVQIHHERVEGVRKFVACVVMFLVGVGQFRYMCTHLLLFLGQRFRLVRPLGAQFPHCSYCSANSRTCPASGWGRSANRATDSYARCWSRRHSQPYGLIQRFAKSIGIAATGNTVQWPRWPRLASWRYGSTGCSAPRRRTRTSSQREQPDLYQGRLCQAVQVNRHSRPRHRPGVRMEESWPWLMAVSMVGGIRSTQYDSRMSRVELRSPNPWLFRVAPGNYREFFCLDTAFALIDGTNSAGQVIFTPCLWNYSAPASR